VDDMEGFVTWDNVLRLALPPVLTIALIPYIHVLAVYAIYWTAFVRLASSPMIRLSRGRPVGDAPHVPPEPSPTERVLRPRKWSTLAHAESREDVMR
jgi:hypothetical protein